MSYDSDRRIVLTLDAGGTNMVFSAMRAGREVVDPVTLPTEPRDLERCLAVITEGFSAVMKNIGGRPAAISFAFPGPADYPAGIIGDLPNLPAFRGGVALGPMLGEKFKVPVFINNDGNLFAYGEAIAGLLPEVNALLAGAGSPKRFATLFGVTLGTGFGGGLVVNGNLHIGDNSAAGEIWIMRHKLDPLSNAEEGASIRAVRRFYAEGAGIDPARSPEPAEICRFAQGEGGGDREAARGAFERLGEIVGDALANAVTLVDGLAVIGGGLSGAHEFFLPRVVREMNGSFRPPGGGEFPRLESRAFNLEDPREREEFIRGDTREIAVPGGGRKVSYDPLMRVGIGITRLGTARAVGIGAYAFALGMLDR